MRFLSVSACKIDFHGMRRAAIKSVRFDTIVIIYRIKSIRDSSSDIPHYNSDPPQVVVVDR